MNTCETGQVSPFLHARKLAAAKGASPPLIAVLIHNPSDAPLYRSRPRNLEYHGGPTPKPIICLKVMAAIIAQPKSGIAKRVMAEESRPPSTLFAFGQCNFDAVAERKEFQAGLYDDLALRLDAGAA